MTYGRARLWLGISGVGSVVTLCSIALFAGLPKQFFGAESFSGVSELGYLATAIGLFMVWLVPLDFLGGFFLPKRYGKSFQSFRDWFSGYITAAFSQGVLFFSFGALIILTAQAFGLFGAMVVVSLCTVACFLVRDWLILRRGVTSDRSAKKLVDAISLIQTWDIFVPRTVIVEHQDIGFTGGIVGFGKNAQIIVPKAWLSFSREQLATAIARRAVALESGSYTLGLILAFVWNLGGFYLCTLFPEAGLASVAQLMTTACVFTLWSFLGLLTLPSVSRSASLKVDQTLVERGMPGQLIEKTAFSMDQFQDGEPERPALIETIFHPVPNVSSRNQATPIRGWTAWNAARTTLFFSWACLGFLSRSVHCNVGRPELWTMLPSD